MDEESRGFSCYFYGHNRTNDCCIAGQEDTYRSIRIAAAVAILLLLGLFGFGVPLFLLHISNNLSKSGQQPHSNTLYYFWSLCITAFLLASLIIVFSVTVFMSHYKEASDQVDVRVFYWLTITCFTILPTVDREIFVVTNFSSTTLTDEN